MNEIVKDDLETLIDTRTKLQGSLLLFIQTFFEILNGREFKITDPTSRESHQVTISKALTKVYRGDIKRLIINVPPGYGKSTMIAYFIAWSMSKYPDSQFLYISYSQTLAAKHTATIKRIIETPHYRKLFDIQIRKDSSAKDDFKTMQGGAVKAFGSTGAITGQDAGLPDLERFSGGVFMDDMHKPDEVHSDRIRSSVINNYNETVKPRPRSPNVPIVFIGQRLHEDDLPAFFLEGKDGYKWDRVILKSIDAAGNLLNPTIDTREKLLIEQEKNPYVFSSQYQQEPQPAGGAIFKPEWFYLAEEEPKIISTFITADTAETDKDYNDATVFSFWGLYKIAWDGIETDLYGLHWLDCLEIRVEPKDLQPEFLQFYSGCMRYAVKPGLIAIEKKSTGATLLSVLNTFQGLNILDVNRTKASGSKTARFLEAQRYVAEKRISFDMYAKHKDKCIEHCRKITANSSHRFDDIADTMYDAIKIALIDKTLLYRAKKGSGNDDLIMQQMTSNMNKVNSLRGRRW